MEGLLDQIFEQNPGQARRNGGDNQIPAQAGLGIGEGLALNQSGYPGPDNGPEVFPEKGDDSHHGAELNQDIKGEDLSGGNLPVEQEGHQHQMGGAGHG